MPASCCRAQRSPGDPFDPDLAAAAGGVSEVVALNEVDELLRLDLVRRTEVPRRFRFRHPLVRRAVYESTPAGWRLGAHARCAELLAARGASPAERAHHLQHSAKQGDMAAIATLREAGEVAAQRAPESAAVWFEEALRLLPHHAPTDLRVELLLARARMLIATGQFDDGHAALLESLTVVPAEPPALRVRITSACAGVEHLLGHHDQAHARLARAIDDIDDHRSPEAAALMIDLAMDRFAVMDYPSMRQWAEAALSATRPLDDRPLLAAASAVAAFAAAADNATAEALTQGAEAANLVDALDDTEVAQRLDAVTNLAGAELYLDRYPESEAHAERALAVARATGQSELIPLADSIRGQVKLLRGKLAEAGDVLDSAIEAARLSGNVQALAGNLTNRSLTALAAGDLQLALTTAEENHVLTDGLDQSLSCAAAVALAAALVEAGDPQRAVAVLTASCGGDDLALIPGVFRPRSLELLTRCWLAAGRRTEAEQAADRVQVAASGLRLRMADAMARRATAAVALDTGDPPGAVEHAIAAALAADEIGAPVEAALSRMLAGRALSRQGRRDACPDRTPPRRRHPRRLRSTPILCRRRPGAATHGRPRPPAQPSRTHRPQRHRIAHRTRAPSRPPRRRPTHERRDRRRALPQPENHRNPPPKHLPQARRLIACRPRPHSRTRSRNPHTQPSDRPNADGQRAHS